MIVDAVAGIVAGAIVTVVLDGRTIDASEPARLAGGVTVGPIVPFVRDVADRIERSVDGTHVRIVRGTREVVVRLAPEAGGNSIDANLPFDSARIPLAVVARELGASVAYDGRSHTLAIELAPAPLATMTFVPYVAPPPGSVPTFVPPATPAPRATPTATATTIPHPRRTPIPIDPTPGP